MNVQVTLEALRLLMGLAIILVIIGLIVANRDLKREIESLRPDAIQERFRKARKAVEELIGPGDGRSK